MIWLRKALILSHRYLGILLSFMFLMWFVTGIGMIYSRGMPRLTPQLRLSRLSPVDLSKVKYSPSEAAQHGNLADIDTLESPVTLVSVGDRPAYRYGRSTTVFADTGEYMIPIDSAEAVKVASRYMAVPEAQAHFIEDVKTPDQWTLTLARQLPLYKIGVDDDAHTILYVSPDSAEVLQLTTRAGRALSWVSVIPHFLYFTALRMSGAWWLRAMTWIPAAACVLAALGLALGVVQYRKSTPHIPYRGWMRWHYVTGLVFGVLTLTWAFSGLLSMEPWAWSEQDEIGPNIQEAFASRPRDLRTFPAFDAAAWNGILNGRTVKEIEFVRVLDEPSYIVRTAPGDQPLEGWPDGGHQPYFVSRDPDSSRFVVSLKMMAERPEGLAIETIAERVRQANPDVAIVEQASLAAYDSYYYSRDGQAPLPVMRFKLGDVDSTWVYVDPAVGRVVGHVNSMNRIERWLYNGLHTLDFGPLYYNRPLWDGVVILLSLGGAMVSGIGFFLGLKRLSRGVARTVKATAAATLPNS